MDISLIVFLVALVFFTYRGYRRGFGASLSRILGLIGGYATSALFTPQLASWLQDHTGFQGIVTFAAAGMILFFGASLVVSLLLSLVMKLLPAQKTLSSASSLGGAATGLLVGTVVGLALVWGLTFFRQIQPRNPSESLQVTVAAKPEPSMPGSSMPGSNMPGPNMIETIANRAAGGAAAVAVKVMNAAPEVAQATKALMQSPGETVRRTQRLFHSEELKRLLDKPSNQRLLQRGDTQAVAQLPEFKALYEHPDFKALASAADIDVDDKQALAERLSKLWRRAQQVKHNPELLKILQDPEFQKQMQSGNPAALLTNPKLQTLAKIIYSAGTEDLSEIDSAGFSDQYKEGPPSAPGTQEYDPKSYYEQPQKEVQVYRWVDSKGQVHFTDKKPAE